MGKYIDNLSEEELGKYLLNMSLYCRSAVYADESITWEDCIMIEDVIERTDFSAKQREAVNVYYYSVGGDSFIGEEFSPAVETARLLNKHVRGIEKLVQISQKKVGAYYRKEEEDDV